MHDSGLVYSGVDDNVERSRPEFRRGRRSFCRRADDTTLTVSAERGSTENGICSTAFLEYAFRTDSYRLEIVFNADGSWSYVSDTMLQVHGRPEPFRRRDRNTLFKVAEPTPNPLSVIRKKQRK